MNVYTRKEERPKINNQSFYLRKLEKEQIKSKLSRRKERIRIKADIKEIENRISKKISKNQKLVLGKDR